MQQISWSGVFPAALTMFTAAGVLDTSATSAHLIVYNNPANSAPPALGTGALRDLYLESCARGVKSTFPTVHLVHELRATLDDGFRIFYGSQYGGYCRLPLLDLNSHQRQQLERLLSRETALVGSGTLE